MGSVRGCSCKGFFYYPPWSSIIVLGLMGTGAALFLYNSYEARESVRPIVRSLQAQSSLHDVMPLNEAAWITTLAVASTVIGITFVVAIFRTYQKCIKNYDLQKSSKHTNRMRCCQFWEFWGLLAAVLAALWMALVVGLAATWYSRAQSITSLSNLALARNSGCVDNGCMDGSALYFLTVQQCLCNATTITQLHNRAERLEDQTWLCIIGSGLMIGASILSVAFVALSFAFTSKSKMQFKLCGMQHRYEEYMGVKHNQAVTAAQISATSAYVDTETRAPSAKSLNRGDSAQAAGPSFLGHRQGSGYASTYSYTGTYNDNSYGLEPTAPDAQPEDIEAQVDDKKASKKKSKKSKSKKEKLEMEPVEVEAPQERAPWELDDQHTTV